MARCYSLSSSPHAGDLPTITVKRTACGHASNWIADHVRAGFVLDTLPLRLFSPRSLEGDFLLFAAGSGITPVISILKSALAAGRGRVVLIYANRDERSVHLPRRAAPACGVGPAAGDPLARLAARRAHQAAGGAGPPLHRGRGVRLRPRRAAQPRFLLCQANLKPTL